MARAPLQVIVFAYRFTIEDQLEYAIFFRETGRFGNFWQAISGGGEDDETPLQAARREAGEEAGLPASLHFWQLESMAMLPADLAAGELQWGPAVLVVPEYCFAVEAGSHEIVLSSEHTEYRWVTYEQGQQMLKWDSNRNALWELNHRLLNGAHG